MAESSSAASPGLSSNVNIARLLLSIQLEKVNAERTWIKNGDVRLRLQYTPGQPDIRAF